MAFWLRPFGCFDGPQITYARAGPHLRCNRDLESILSQAGTPEALSANWLQSAAAERMLEIISEASRRLPDPWKARHPDIPWTRIAGIGNVLRHDYERIDPAVIVGLKTLGYLRELRETVEALLTEQEPDWRRLREERRARRAATRGETP